MKPHPPSPREPPQFRAGCWIAVNAHAVDVSVQLEEPINLPRADGRIRHHYDGRLGQRCVGKASRIDTHVWGTLRITAEVAPAFRGRRHVRDAEPGLADTWFVQAH